MNLFRILSGTALLCVAGAGLSSCLSAPDYAVEPSIDFNDIQVTRYRPGNGITGVDTLKFVLNFRDGDGDLGLSDDDLKTTPFNQTTGGHNNKGYGLNYYIQPYLKTGTTYTKYVVPGGTIGQYDGRFPRLVPNTDAKAAPIKGELNYKLPINIDGAPYLPGQIFRFEISILDRGLHESNTITTSDVTLGQ